MDKSEALAALEADNKGRVEAATAELKELLKNYSVQIQVVERRVNGQLANFELQIVAVN